MVSRFDDKKDDCSDEASWRWRWRWRYHQEFIEGLDRQTDRQREAKRMVVGINLKWKRSFGFLHRESGQRAADGCRLVSACICTINNPDRAMC